MTPYVNRIGIRVDGEASCYWCRTPERNAFLLNNNHYPDMGLRVGHCVAQLLTRNHVTYALERVRVGPRDRFNKPRGVPSMGAERDGLLNELERYLTRAAELWSHHSDAAWMDEARTELDTAGPVVEHHAVPDSEQGALL